MVLRTRNRAQTRHLGNTRRARQRPRKRKHEPVDQAHGPARQQPDADAAPNGFPAAEERQAEAEDGEDVEAAGELLAFAHLVHDGFVVGGEAGGVGVGGIFDSVELWL
jgi:hypothetical protein